MECEVCGRKASKKAKIEGVVLNVCKGCSSLGERVGKPRKKMKKKSAPSLPKLKELDRKYYKKIKEARESRGWDRKDLAKLVKERYSVIQRVERGDMPPPLDLARRLEKALGIKLLHEESGKKEFKKKEKFVNQSKKLTIGDVVDIKS